MNDGLGLKLNDMYPGLVLGEDTATSVVPDADDIDKVSTEDKPTARENASTTEPNKKMITISIVVIILLIIIFGMD